MIEPGAPGVAREHRHLTAVVGGDVGSRLDRQHREGLADLRGGAKQPGDSDRAAIGIAEQPAVLSLLLGGGRCGELVEAVGDDQAASTRKLAAFRAEAPIVLSLTVQAIV